TLTSGPIRYGTTAIVGTTGTSTTSSRLFAWIDGGAIEPSVVLGDFVSTSPGIAPDGTIYSGAVQKIISETFDIIWTTPQTAPETPHYKGAPAFRGTQVLLSTGTTGAIDVFTPPLASAPTSIAVAGIGVDVSAPTVAADGTATLTTDDRRAIALNPDGSVR